MLKMEVKMKRLIRYKCMIENYLPMPKNSFEIKYAEITAETKAEAMRMASTLGCRLHHGAACAGYGI